MRFFYDTEFIEDGRTIDLVSIGVVSEDGREYYAVSTDFDGRKANPWVRDNVLDKLPSPSDPVWKSREQIREELLDFFTAAGEPVELWAWVGAYDHVVLAQLWGDMSHMPRQLPRYTNELKQLWVHAGKPQLPKPPKGNHDALVDAKFNITRFKICLEHLALDDESMARTPW